MNYRLRDVDGTNIGKYSFEEFRKKVYPRLVEAKMNVSSIGSPVGKVFIDDEQGIEEQLGVLDTLCNSKPNQL